jgi:hypothetical protein
MRGSPVEPAGGYDSTNREARMNAVGEKLNGQGNGACPKMPTSRTDKDHAMLNIKTDDLDMESFMANLAWDAAKFDPGKREHFIHVMRTLVDCY